MAMPFEAMLGPGAIHKHRPSRYIARMLEYEKPVQCKTWAGSSRYVCMYSSSVDVQYDRVHTAGASYIETRMRPA